MTPAYMPDNVKVWYFAFHPPGKKDWLQRWGHVDAFGMSASGAWVFLLPERRRIKIFVENHPPTIDIMFADLLSRTDVLRVETQRDFNLPPINMHSCASICGALVGIRAFTPHGLRKKLLRNGAERINGHKQQSESA